MFRTLILSTAFLFSGVAVAADHHQEKNHHAGDRHGEGHHHGDNHHGEHHDEGDNHDKHHHDAEGSTKTKPMFIRTAKGDAALAEGGQPVVVEVLGAVCDFCAKAMNKTFGKRPEVAAAYVDLDTKTLNLVLRSGAALSDEEIIALVKKAGYKASSIHRGSSMLERR